VASAADEKAEKTGNWQTIVIFADKECNVRLRMQRQASLADVDWMRVEVENKGKTPMAVDTLHYQIECETYHLKTNMPDSSFELAQGHDSNFSIDPKRPLTESSNCDYHSTLLGLAPRYGWQVRSKFHFRMDLKDRRVKETSKEGIPFTFKWLYPTEAGFEAMRSRLKKLLQNPKYEFNHAYILGAYLGVPEVARAASREDLLAALTPRQGSVDGREAILGNLLKRYPNDPVVKSYFHERLRAGDEHAVGDAGAEEIWDKTFIKPLVRLLESDYYKYRYALTVLHEHRVDWKSDQALARQLSAAVRKAYPEVESKDLVDFDRWVSGVEDLGLTGDRKMIQLLSPVLDDKRELHPPTDGLVGLQARKEHLRVCEVALESILTILEGEPDDAYAKAGSKEILARRQNTAAEWTALRDRMIADLKLRLKGDKKDSPRPAPNPHKQK
jgi:hypothetical protein